jgi:cystathionine beta-lyase/cystathionine gamma-synthase
VRDAATPSYNVGTHHASTRWEVFCVQSFAGHAGEAPDPETGALTPPIHTSAAFQLPGSGPRPFDALTMASPDSPYAYARWGHPMARMLEENMAAPEGPAVLAGPCLLLEEGARTSRTLVR